MEIIFTSDFTHWHRSEMLTQNEDSALNQLLSLLLSLCPPPHSFLSSSQPTEEQGTAGPRTMCECEGHLSQTGLYLWP